MCGTGSPATRYISSPISAIRRPISRLAPISMRSASASASGFSIPVGPNMTTPGLPTRRDRAPASSFRQEQDRRSHGCPAYPDALRARARHADFDHDEAVSRQERPLGCRGRGDARGLDQVCAPAGHSLVPSLHKSRRFLNCAVPDSSGIRGLWKTVRSMSKTLPKIKPMRHVVSRND